MYGVYAAGTISEFVHTQENVVGHVTATCPLVCNTSELVKCRFCGIFVTQKVKQQLTHCMFRDMMWGQIFVGNNITSHEQYIILPQLHAAAPCHCNPLCGHFKLQIFKKKCQNNSRQGHFSAE